MSGRSPTVACLVSAVSRLVGGRAVVLIGEVQQQQQQQEEEEEEQEEANKTNNIGNE